jgi:hypothetical protein
MAISYDNDYHNNQNTVTLFLSPDFGLIAIYIGTFLPFDA